ncbi:MAG: class I SAM-dependent methyltransferase [Candidatus Sericytochromatia bacterium]
MELIDEYLNQQSWRAWEKYLPWLPLQPTDHLVDLGCSVGGFLQTVAPHCASSLGVDLNPEFIAYCASHPQPQQRFLCGDIASLGDEIFQQANGVWASFSLTYLPDPAAYIRRIHAALPPGGWLAVLDIDGFISGNLPLESPFQAQVQAFEQASHQGGKYDFALGHKLAGYLQAAGFELLHHDDNVTDVELNFDGSASEAVWQNWAARLARMPGLKQALGPAAYAEMAQELLAYLKQETHSRRQNLYFGVGRKKI